MPVTVTRNPIDGRNLGRRSFTASADGDS